MELSYFRRDGDDPDLLVPQTLAQSAWSEDQMHGVAVSGALARAAEALAGDGGIDGLVPARFTVDLFRPARMVASTATAEMVRRGRRLCLVDVELTQGGQRVARASALFLEQGGTGEGRVWQPAERPCAPPTDVVPPSDEPRVPFIHSSAGWSQDFAEHQNADRKQVWSTCVPVVAGEPLTPFQAAAAGADAASLVTNWGTRGVEHINTDLTLALSRLPEGVEIGLAATDRVEHDGVAVGTAAMFDRRGQLGTVVVTSLSNALRAVDFEKMAYTDDGRQVGTHV